MAVNTRPIEQSMEKWERNSGNAVGDYLIGAKNPRRPWAESAANAEGNYKTAVVAAANAGRFGKGIKKAGNSRWIGQIEKKGGTNYQTGITGSGGDWATGAKPYITAVGSLNLDPRGPKNSAANYNRAQAVGQVQYKLKQEMLK